MDHEIIPKIDSRGCADIMDEIGRLAKEYVPEWKFSAEDPDAGMALAYVFARRTAETVEKFNKTPLNHRRAFYNMLGAAALPAVPASGYVQFRLSGVNKDSFFVKDGFVLFSPIVDEIGTRLVFETTQSAWLTSAHIKETVYADGEDDILCFWDEKEKPFKPSPRDNSNKRSLRFKHELLGSITENCRLYMTIPGTDGERWAKRLSDPGLARFVQISDGGETEVDCFNEGGRMRIAASACKEIRADILNIGEFEDLSFGGISIAFEGRNIKPGSVFVNGELETDNTFRAFGDAPAVYDQVYIESSAAFSKTGAVVTLSFNVDFEVTLLGEIPEPEIPNRLFVRKSDVRAPERKKITVDEVVWEYWNGTGFAVLRGLEAYKNIFSGIGGDGAAVKKSHYELKFIVPPDIAPVLVGAAERLCVRARIRRMKNAYAMPSECYIPRIENIRVSYKYDRPIPVNDIAVTNNCGESFAPGVYPFSRLPDTALYIGFDIPVRNFTLLVCRGVPSKQLDSVEWSAFTANGRETVQPLTSAALAGYFVFEMKNAPVQSVMFGRCAYWIKAKISRNENISLDGLMLNCVPVTQFEEIESFCSDSVVERLNLERKNILELRIFINAAKRNQEEQWEPLESGWTLDRAEGVVRFSPALNLNPNSRTVKMQYRCGGGTAGNIPEGREFVPSLTDGTVSGAANPFPFTGGRDGEDAEHTEIRLSNELRHGNRPITKNDLEEFLTGGDILSARVSPDGRGGSDIEVTAVDGTNAEDIRSMVYAKLADMLPVGAGEPKIKVIYENR